MKEQPGRGNVLVARMVTNRGQRGRCPSRICRVLQVPPICEDLCRFVDLCGGHGVTALPTLPFHSPTPPRNSNSNSELTPPPPSPYRQKWISLPSLRHDRIRNLRKHLPSQARNHHREDLDLHQTSAKAANPSASEENHDCADGNFHSSASCRSRPKTSFAATAATSS